MPIGNSLDRRHFLGSAAVAVAATRVGMLGTIMQQVACGAVRSPIAGDMPAFDGATEWLNSPPLARDALRGKVVLVDFWTYTCINWLRTLPYVRAWAAKYGSQGLVVVGVHSPEFTFERDVDNVRRAVKAMNISYPIAVDSDHAVWRAFDNAYWPALYLADATAKLRFHHFGEGNFKGSESMIQRLLAESGRTGVPGDFVVVEGRGPEAPADWDDLRSQESYVGYERAEGFASPGGAKNGERRTYTVPSRLELGQWALGGDWTIHGQGAALDAAPGRIAFRFHARDLHLVMGPPARGGEVPFRVRLDGQPPGAAHGADVDAAGRGTLSEQRLHQLIRQSPPIADRLFEIEFLDPGAEAYVFTFG